MTQGEMNWKPMAPKAIKAFIYYNKNKIREEWFPGISELYSVSPHANGRKLEIERRICFLEAKGRVLWLFTV